MEQLPQRFGPQPLPGLVIAEAESTVQSRSHEPRPRNAAVISGTNLTPRNRSTAPMQNFVVPVNVRTPS